MAWEAGETIGGRYKLERLIGEGGMGVVWSAVQLVTRKPVALKRLKDNYRHEKHVLQRFLREARAACAVRHPNVVEIHDVIELEDGMAVMVMDLLEGESLGQRIEREKSIPLKELALILLPAMSAVATAHAIGIVHRDLKPDNIFLSRTAVGVDVKVLDFGIAKLTATEGDVAATGALTGTGVMLGTPFYMAPEQIYGEKDIDSRADLWAVGIILYECLAGVRPTQGDSIGQILKIVTRDGVAPLRTLRPHLPSDVLDLVDRLLSPDRNKRPSNLDEVIEVLSKYANVTFISSRPPPPLTSTNASTEPLAVSDALGQAATIAATTTTLGKTTASPRRSMVVIGAIAAAGLIAVGVVLATHYGATTASPAPSSAPIPSIDSPPVSAVAAPPMILAPIASTTATHSAAALTASAHTDVSKKPLASAQASATVAPSASSSAHIPGGVVGQLPF